MIYWLKKEPSMKFLKNKLILSARKEMHTKKNNQNRNQKKYWASLNQYKNYVMNLNLPFKKKTWK